MAPREERTQKLQTEPGSQSSGCQVLPVTVLLAPQEHKPILVEAGTQRGHVNYPKTHSQCGRAIMSISEHLAVYTFNNSVMRLPKSQREAQQIGILSVF